MSEGDKVNGGKGPVAIQLPKRFATETEQQELLSKVMAALLHRFARAAGGVVCLDLNEMPPETLLDFAVSGNMAVVTAHEKPKSSLLTGLPPELARKFSR